METSQQSDELKEVRSCAACRHWVVGGALGECRRGWPTPNGSDRAVWPLTRAEDFCGYFAMPAGSGSMAKITDAEILELLRSITSGKLPVKRAWLVDDMMKRGVARSSAVERVERLVRDGVLCVGLVKPPGVPKWNVNHPAVWIAGSPPDGAGAEREENVKRAGPGRPAYGIEAFYEATRGLNGVGKMVVHRAMIRAAPIAFATANRLMEEMRAAGTLRCEDGLWWSAEPTPTIEVA